jgi:hypothetical protein
MQRLFEEWYQMQRLALLKLFPGEGATLMSAHEMPESTLK